MRLFLFITLSFFMIASISDAKSSDSFDMLKETLHDRLDDINRILKSSGDSHNDFPEIKLQNTILKEGEADLNLPLIRVKLSDYLSDTSYEGDPYIYDMSLVEAVKKFQEEKGLSNDGVIGPATLDILNRNLLDEKKQIEVNLHRLNQPEWHNRPDLRIDVDIARYHLTAYEDGKVAFEMPVVVGSTERKTVRFKTLMTGVRLNPGWTLPPTIKQEDYIPKLRKNPEWVAKRGVKIYSGWGKDAVPIDPTTIDWNYLSDNEIKAMRFYKGAGEANPLGQYRFLMNNRYDIYLHDTNKKYLFGKSARAKSSGCVRVSDPRKVAEFLLKDNPDWTSEKIDGVLASGKTYNIGAKRSIPVYFDYKTAWLNAKGELVLGNDIYDLDDQAYRDMIAVIARSKTSQKTLVD